MVFIDYGSAFSTIVPSKLSIKLAALRLTPALCSWVMDSDGPPPGGEGRKLHFNDPQHWGSYHLHITSSPLPYSLFTHDCLAMHASNSIIKFADSSLITNIDETGYREEVRR